MGWNSNIQMVITTSVLVQRPIFGVVLGFSIICKMLRKAFATRSNREVRRPDDMAIVWLVINVQRRSQQYLLSPGTAKQDVHQRAYICASLTASLTAKEVLLHYRYACLRMPENTLPTGKTGRER